MKPILSNTEMVRAILDGRKTVTRRVIKPQPEGAALAALNSGEDSRKTLTSACAPYQAGDILYVRETWGDYATENDPGAGYYMYRADYPDGATTTIHPDGTVFELPRWRPSILMPKEAARIFLRVTDVRVERLQDITINGLQNEGIVPHGYLSQYAVMTSNFFEEFKTLWDSTIKPTDRAVYGWAADPWVWVILFERIGREEAVSK